MPDGFDEHLSLGPLPKMSPREIPCEEAKRRILNELDSVRQRYNLTPSEYLMLLANEQYRFAQMCVSSERSNK